MAKRIGRTNTQVVIFDKDNNKVYYIGSGTYGTKDWKDFDWSSYKENKLDKKTNKESLIKRLEERKEERKPVPQGDWGRYKSDKAFCEWVDEVLKDL